MEGVPPSRKLSSRPEVVREAEINRTCGLTRNDFDNLFTKRIDPVELSHALLNDVVCLNHTEGFVLARLLEEGLDEQSQKIFLVQELYCEVDDDGNKFVSRYWVDVQCIRSYYRGFTPDCLMEYDVATIRKIEAAKRCVLSYIYGSIFDYLTISYFRSPGFVAFPRERVVVGHINPQLTHRLKLPVGPGSFTEDQFALSNAALAGKGAKEKKKVRGEGVDFEVLHNYPVKHKEQPTLWQKEFERKNIRRTDAGKPPTGEPDDLDPACPHCGKNAKWYRFVDGPKKNEVDFKKFRDHKWSCKPVRCLRGCCREITSRTGYDQHIRTRCPAYPQARAHMRREVMMRSKSYLQRIKDLEDPSEGLRFCETCDEPCIGPGETHPPAKCRWSPQFKSDNGSLQNTLADDGTFHKEGLDAKVLEERRKEFNLRVYGTEKNVYDLVRDTSNGSSSVIIARWQKWEKGVKKNPALAEPPIFAADDGIIDPSRAAPEATNQTKRTANKGQRTAEIPKADEQAGGKESKEGSNGKDRKDTKGKVKKTTR